MANFKFPYTGTNWNKFNGVGSTLIENWLEERSVAEIMIKDHQKMQEEINKRNKEALEHGELPPELLKIKKQNEQIEKEQARLKTEQENLAKKKIELQNRIEVISTNLKEQEEKDKKKNEKSLPYENVVAATDAYQKHHPGKGKRGRLLEAELLELAKKQLESEPDDGVDEWKSTFQTDYCFDFTPDMSLPDEATRRKYAVPITYWNDNVNNKDINVYCSTGEKEKEELGQKVKFGRHSTFSKPIEEFKTKEGGKFKDF